MKQTTNLFQPELVGIHETPTPFLPIANIMKILSLITLSSILLYSTIHAAVVIPNIPAAGNGFSFSISGPNASTFGGLVPLPDRELAFTVTTGSSSATLSSLSMVMISSDNSAPIDVTIGEGSLPGTTNRSLIFSQTLGPAAGIQTVSFARQNAPTLNANTTYWFHITSSDAGLASLLSNDATPNYQGSGWTMGHVQSKSGTTAPWVPSSQYARVQLTAVPEPSTAAIGALGLSLILLRRRSFA